MEQCLHDHVTEKSGSVQTCQGSAFDFLTIESTTCLSSAGDSPGALVRAVLVCVILVLEICRFEGHGFGSTPAFANSNLLAYGVFELAAARDRRCRVTLLK